MKNIWAQNTSTGIMDADITSTNMMLSELGLSEETHTRYYTDSMFEKHESGESLYKSDGASGHTTRTNEEIQAGVKYKAWFNVSIDKQLIALDVKRVRPTAELNDPLISSEEKAEALTKLQEYNTQAQTLRNQRLV